MVKAEDIKMLTPTDKDNLENFEKLKPNSRRVFKHRLIKKCNSALKDIEIVAGYHEKLKLKIDKFLDINKIVDIMKLYEDLCLLQNV